MSGMMLTRRSDPSQEAAQLQMKLYELEQAIRWLQARINDRSRRSSEMLMKELLQAYDDAYIIRRQLRTMASK